MKQIILSALFLSLFAFAPTSLKASEAFTITDAYTYATTSVQKNGAVFFQLSNASRTPDTLIKAETDVAARVELHTHTMDGGIMMMREVEGYDIPEQDKLTLKPTGHHIMLMDLHAPLKKGERFPLTLNFEHADAQAITVHILPPGTTPQDTP